MTDASPHSPDSADETPSPPTPEEVIRHLYGEGKPLIFVVIAAQIASSADELCELLQAFIGKKKL